MTGAERYVKLRAKGLCVACARRKVQNGKAVCDTCAKARRKAYVRKVRTRTCLRCGMKLKPGYTYVHCKTCRFVAKIKRGEQTKMSAQNISTSKAELALAAFRYVKAVVEMERICKTDASERSPVAIEESEQRRKERHETLLSAYRSYLRSGGKRLYDADPEVRYEVSAMAVRLIKEEIKTRGAA